MSAPSPLPVAHSGALGGGGKGGGEGEVGRQGDEEGMEEGVEVRVLLSPGLVLSAEGSGGNGSGVGPGGTPVGRGGERGTGRSRLPSTTSRALPSSSSSSLLPSSTPPATLLPLPPPTTSASKRLDPLFPSSLVPRAPSTAMYWSKTPVSGRIPRGMRAHTAVLVGNDVWCFGGCDRGGNCFREVWKLDCGTSSLPPFLSKRIGLIGREGGGVRYVRVE
jgi:hypothetical protein